MPVIADGHVFVTNLTGNDDMPGQITAIDGHCGTTEWTADLSATVLSTPAVHDGILVVISTAGIVYGLDVTTGDEIWNTDIQGWSPGNSEFDHLRVTEYHHGPSIVDQTVYVGTPARSLYALDLTSGDIHWDYDLPGLALAAPAIQNEKIVLPLYGRMDTADSTGVIAVTRTGEREWWNNDMRLGTGAPVIQNSTVVFGHVTGHRLYGVNIDTGELLWEVNLPNEAETNVIKYTAPIGVKDIVVIAGHLPDSYGSPTDQRAPALIAFDPTSGTKQWSYLYEKRSEDTALLQPATDGHLIYAGTSEGYLMAFDPDDGTLVWEHHPGSGAINGIAIADNTIVAVEGNYRNESAGRVLAFH